MFGKRILIAVPHPDDEVVACCAAIGRARAEGAEIFALYLTHGCIARDVRWPWDRKRHDVLVARRRAEAETAAKFLGITPVGWSPRPARHVWQELPQVYDELKIAIARHAPDQLWIPAYEGGNPDHDGLNAVAQVIASSRSHGCDPAAPADGEQSRRAPINVFEFAEYNFFGGKTRSQEFPYPNGTEHILELTPEERARKAATLKLYASEKRNLNYVKTRRESFRPLVAYDYMQPPHPGTLWYERFHWVPFRHPMVNFSNHGEISLKIAEFIEIMK